MNSKQRKRREYLIKKGYIKPEPESLKRSENGLRFEYPKCFDMPFIKFSSERRDKNIHPLFKDFYEGLTIEQQNQITVTNI